MRKIRNILQHILELQCSIWCTIKLNNSMPILCSPTNWTRIHICFTTQSCLECKSKTQVHEINLVKIFEVRRRTVSLRIQWGTFLPSFSADHVHYKMQKGWNQKFYHKNIYLCDIIPQKGSFDYAVTPSNVIEWKHCWRREILPVEVGQSWVNWMNLWESKLFPCLFSFL